MGQALPAWKLFGSLRQAMGMSHLKPSAAAVMLELSKNVDVFEGMRYQALAQVKRQFPDVGGRDQYYGGTAYSNDWRRSAFKSRQSRTAKISSSQPLSSGCWIGCLRQRGRTVDHAGDAAVQSAAEFPPITADGTASPSRAYATMNPADAQSLGIIQNDVIEIKRRRLNGARSRLRLATRLRPAQWPCRGT